jgi:LytS/YehU family sensor histidine kinase
VLLRTWARETLGDSVLGAAGAIGAAVILGRGVRRFCRARPWPARPGLGFYLRHLAAGTFFAVTWVLAIYAWESLVHRMPLLGVLRYSARDFAWQGLMGLWLYGVLAGIAYAFAAQERIIEEEGRAARAEAAAARASFEALSARVHPHFLFNALHTVSALTRHDPARAEEAIEQLGEMLRYALDERSGDLVPLSREWEFTRRYVEFERLRFEDRLRLEVDAEPDALKCGVPRFLLQTLVENAVRHSVASRVEGGRIAVEVRIRDGQLALRVEDDGPRTIARSGPAESLGTGLSSLRVRLSSAFGERARLAVDPGEEAGFAVTVTVPRVEVPSA